MSKRRRRWCWWGVAAAAVLGVVWVVFAFFQAGPRREFSFPLTPVAASPYRNTRSDAKYVGSQACRDCHADEHASYCATGMGRSLGKVDVASEPPDATFVHAWSKRRYHVYRKDGQLHHRELLLASGKDREEVVLSDHPMKYVIGSGAHSRSYLIEIDGFLVESPVTWYASRQAWGMSPGFDHPMHQGFARATSEECLDCHVGRLEVRDQSVHRIKVVEAAIGCERCHGPGSLHVARHTGVALADDRPPPSFDDTIVNPARLSRELGEAVCQQCHMRSSASILVRRRSDFRPGLPLEDFRHDYRIEPPQPGMTVVGHVEQMHLSRCYQDSRTLTCLTCHNPHDEPRPPDRIAYHRAICLNCHETRPCTVDAGRLRRESPANNCVQCHMPTSDTEIPHVAFTHHRIGLHESENKPAPAARNGQFELRPLLDLSRFRQVERQYSLGLGYLDVDMFFPQSPEATRMRQRALELLSGVREQGARGGVLDAALARVRFELGLEGVEPLAKGALADPDLAGQDRANALLLLAESYTAQGRHQDAAAALEQLVTLRRDAQDWLALAKCYKGLGKHSAHVAALNAAVQINPRLVAVHRVLANHHRRQGDESKAAYHERRAMK